MLLKNKQNVTKQCYQTIDWLVVVIEAPYIAQHVTRVYKRCTAARHRSQLGPRPTTPPPINPCTRYIQKIQ